MSSLKSAMPHISAHTGVRAAFAVLDGALGLPPAEQVVGVSVLFTALCEVCNLDPSQLINAAQRRLKDDDNFVHVEVRALREYIANEVRK